MRSPHLQSYRVGTSKKNKTLVPDVAPPCCCYTECDGGADDDAAAAQAERRAVEAAAAAAAAHRAATAAHLRRRAALLHWCCMCVCMCLCCGWSCAEAAPLTWAHALNSDAPTPPAGWQTDANNAWNTMDATRNSDAMHTSNFWSRADDNAPPAPPPLPAAAQYLIDSAQSQPHSTDAIEAAATTQVSASAGTPVPPAPTSSVSDAELAEFTEHYHIASQKQLKATMVALQRAYTRSRRAGMGRSAGLSKASEETAVTECEVGPAADLSDADKKSLSDGKYALVPIVFVTTLATSITPWYLGRLDRAIDFISFGACLSAGVILGAAFSHLSPDSDKAWANYFCLSQNTSVIQDYPWTGLVSVGVLLLLITIDSALLRSGLEGGHDHGDGHGHSHGGNGGQHGHSHAVPQLPAHYDPTGEKKRKREAAEAAAAAAKTLNSPAKPAAPTNNDSHNGVVLIHAAPTQYAISISKESQANTSSSSSPTNHAAVAAAPCDNDCEHGLPASNSFVMASAVVVSGSGMPEFAMAAAPKTYGALEDAESGEPCSDRNHVHNHTSEQELTSAATAVVPAEGEQPSAIEAIRGSKRAVGQAYVFFIALSVHSIFDGLSIGAEQDLNGFYALLFAVGGHKLLDGFALGVPVFFARLPRAHTIFALVFCALCTPVGIIVGMVSTEQVSGVQGSLSKAIILAMSFGSFVFISIVELLPAGLNDGKHLISKMFVTGLGWGAMVLIAIWV